MQTKKKAPTQPRALPIVLVQQFMPTMLPFDYILVFGQG